MNKFDTCQGCPDRHAECHGSCEGYQARCKINEMNREIRHRESVRTTEREFAKRQEYAKKRCEAKRRKVKADRMRRARG